MTAIDDVCIRPMTRGDVPSADDVFDEAFADLRSSGEPRTPIQIARARQRVAHLLATDPAGSYVAEHAGEIVGMTQAHRNGPAWVLALLAVRPKHQDRGIGKGLLERALAYGESASSKVLFSSQDSRALRRYVNAGFDLQPAIRISGAVRAGSMRDDPSVHPQGIGELDRVIAIDRALGAANRSRHLELLMRTGPQLLIKDDDAYAFFDAGRIAAFGARSVEAAQSLIETCFSRCPQENEVQIGWVTAGQQWAIAVAVRAGLTLQASGPIMTKDWAPLGKTYLPSGLFG